MAQIVTRSIRVDYITPVIAELHWLPVRYRTKFQVAVNIQSADCTKTTLP